MNKLDTRKLAAIPKSSKEAKMVIEYLSTRERSSRTTNLRGLMHLVQNHCGVVFKDRKAYDQIWLDLRDIGIGGPVFSKRGIPTHFDWQGYNSASVAQAALDPTKHPEMAKFRNRRLKKVHATAKPQGGPMDRPVTSKTRPHQNPPAMSEEQQDRLMASQKGTISADAVFMSFGSDAFRLELKEGFNEKEKQKLLKYISALPVEG